MSLFDFIQPSSLNQAASLLENIVNKFVVSPTGTGGVSGFLFNILDDEQTSLESRITDHYVEDNSAIQDHIALSPERFTLRGYLGELNDLFPRGIAPVMQTAERLTNIASELPQFATQAQQTYNALSNITSAPLQTLTQSATLYDMFNQFATNATRQQAAFNYFYSLWLSRQLVTVDTPWNVFTDMAIERVNAVQRGETKIISDFSVTFKKIRKVTDQSTTFTFSGRLMALGGTTSIKGLTIGVSESISGVKVEMANQKVAG